MSDPGLCASRLFDYTVPTGCFAGVRGKHQELKQNGRFYAFSNSETTVSVQLPGKRKPEREEGEEGRSWYSYLCFPVHWSKNMEGQVISPEEPEPHFV